MRVPIRRNSGFNSDRRPSNGSIQRWNYPYSSYFGRRIGNRVYGMPFGNQQVQRREFKQTQRLTKSSEQVSSRRKSVKTVEEIHDGTDYLLCSNMSKVSYISYPPLSSTEYGSRAESYLKVLGVTVSGSVVLKQTGMREADGSHGIHGIFTTVVVRDRRPCQFSAVDPIIPFAELFGGEKRACSALRVRDSYKNRFSVIYQKKHVVNSALSTHVFRYSFSVKFTRFPFWVSFKDTSNAEPTGRYSNVFKNALVVYYVWLCDSNVTAEVHVQYDLNYIG
nr:BV1 [Pepper yellow leaf curl Thailand virus]WAK98705.1 BV1 [Pepper yellow leaf curl Thailand virus]